MRGGPWRGSRNGMALVGELVDAGRGGFQWVVVRDLGVVFVGAPPTQHSDIQGHACSPRFFRSKRGM